MNNIEKPTKNKNQIHQYEVKNPINIPHKNQPNEQYKEQLNEIIKNIMIELQQQTITEKDQENKIKIKQEINNSIYQIQIISTLIKESEKIDQEDYESMLKMIKTYYSQYLVLTKMLQPQKQHITNIKSLETNETKNILIFLKDQKTSEFCILKDLEGNGKKDLQTTLKKALKSNIKLLTMDAFEEIRSTQKIKKIKNNSLPNNRDENYPWEVRRKDCTRMSIIFLRTCPENLEKLKSFYNLPHLESIILIGGIIKVGDEYNKLAPLTKQIDDNRKYINYLNELFSDYTTDIDKLNKIISETEIIYDTLNYSPKQK